MKIKRHYTDIGKTPGILIEENKRRKLLRELGVDAKIEENKAKLQEEIKESEPKIEDAKSIGPDLTTTSSKALNSIEKDK